MSVPQLNTDSSRIHGGHDHPSGRRAAPFPESDRRLVAEGVGHPSRDQEQIKVSFVIPVKDEEATIIELYERIADELGTDDTFEVVFVDDGSRDGSWDAIRALCDREPARVRGLRFRRNAGKAAALTAGFRAAQGGIVFTLDADLQDDPKEIRRFLAKLAEGYDLVSGWKKVRHDPWHKVLPSRIFNAMLSRVSGVRLHDHNCGFKCYRSDVVKGLTLHGELHRMVPALAAIEGFRSAEIVVEHHPRRHGVSKYGFERYLRGFVDMLVVGFFRKYRERPGHFIGGLSFCCGVTAVVLMLGGLALAFAAAPAAASAALVCGTVLLCTAILGAFFSLLAEMTIRGGLGSHWKLPIIQDTAATPPTSMTLRPSLAPVPVAYHCRRSTDQVSAPATTS
jgi:glycosyltransferase involved in cell wall biosynthesis